MNNKRLVSALTAALVVGATSTALAASNPFSDVPQDSWAYNAVVTLANDGVIDGFPNGTFQGNQNMTRYEMAQIIAKAMTKENMSKADKALLDKLAAEFSSELNNLGVRVADLEGKSDNVKITGDVRIRFESRNQHGLYLNDAKGQNLHAEKFSDNDIEKISNLKVDKDYKNSPIFNKFVDGLALPQIIVPVYDKNQPNNSPTLNFFKMNPQILQENYKKSFEVSKEAYTLKDFIVPIDIPAGTTGLDAVKLAYDKISANKQQAGPIFTIADNAYKQITTAQKLPEYLYMLSEQFAKKADKEKDSSYRLRLNLESNISDKTEVGTRLVGNFDMDADSGSELSFDRLWVKHNFSEGNSIQVGRIGAFIGDGLVYDDDYDGVVANAKVGKTKFEFGVGYPLNLVNEPKKMHQTMNFAQVTAPVAKDITVNAFVTRLSSGKTDNPIAKAFGVNYEGFKHNIYGVSLAGNHGKFAWNGAYAKRTSGEDNVVFLPVLREGKGRDAWTIGTSYKEGPAKLSLQYFRLGQNSPILASTYDLRYIKNWKGFIATAEYDFTKNIHAKLAYTFKGSPVEKYQGAVDPASQYYAQVEYNF